MGLSKRTQKKTLYALVRVNLRALGLGILAAVLSAAAVFTVSAMAPQEGVSIPIVMYHSILKDEARHGKYVISPAEFENDLLYLQEHGYTTILIQDLINYTQGGSLPEKPVLLTFDDGYYNNYFYAFPIAKKYGCKFVISPIVKHTEAYSETGETNAYYSHATWEHLKEMADSGLVEIQNHSYDMHKSKGRLGVKQKPGEPDEAYRQVLTSDLTQAQDAIAAHLGAPPTAFVYPFGAVSQSTPEIVKALGFSATLTCREITGVVTRDPESLYGLGRFLRVSGISSREFFKERMKLS
ncbi:polysaccharide deacetylase family protein [Acutalibacter sp. 1XD8-33]|uniref:polysaccharide deacetylase family protein n=1 Tax=Acutalibacter sp. 1XD8-33 TaxID=2320081 RepID=UPI001FAAB97F|nr:polysaccharide deacetylase family protein [Acutalibacter sp. 1XD8-33]